MEYESKLSVPQNHLFNWDERFTFALLFSKILIAEDGESSSTAEVIE